MLSNNVVLGVVPSTGALHTTVALHHSRAVQHRLSIVDPQHCHQEFGTFRAHLQYTQTSSRAPRYVQTKILSQCQQCVNIVHDSLGCNLYCLDKNYGGVLIIWDKLFGTFQEEHPKEEIIYGLVVSPQSFNPLYLQVLVFIFYLCGQEV